MARLMLTVPLVLGAGTACIPWTVRPIEDRSPGATTGPLRFNAAAYVASVWSTRVVQEATSFAAAVSATTTTAAGPARFVTGSGTIVRVDTASRVGLALVDLEPGDGRPDVSLQIGPVLRGTALRDALSFIRFSDFANQLDYAAVANALNAHVLGSVLGGVTPGSLDGRTVSFWGAAKTGDAAPGRLTEVVPVILERKATAP